MVLVDVFKLGIALMGGWCGFLSCATFESAPYLSWRALAFITLQVHLLFVRFSVNKTLWFVLKKIFISLHSCKVWLLKKSIFTPEVWSACHFSHTTFVIPFFFYVHNILFSVWKLVIMVIIVSAHKVSQILWWQGKRYNNLTACYGGGGMPGDVGVFTRIMTWPTQCMPEGVHSLHTHLGKHRHAYQLWSSWTTTRKLTSNGSFIRRHLIWRLYNAQKNVSVW